MTESTIDGYRFDRFLRYDELTTWLHAVAHASPEIVEVASFGTSHEGRDLWLVTITDRATGSAETKPAHWVDASIHAVELTATVAACHLIHRLVSGWHDDDPIITELLRTRTMYVVPRVNPDGAELVLSDQPRLPRSSVRPWPWTDGHRWPGLAEQDVDGDGRILEMRIADPDGAWMPHPDEPELMVPVPAEGPPAGAVRYRLLTEGTITDYDGFTIPTPPDPEGLDLNRNFPAGWSTAVTGSGDHPLSEPEIDALVRAIVARPGICGYHALHTFGGVLLRPSSTQPDSALPSDDLWVWNELGRHATELTGYGVHSVYEDFTWDRTDLMSGAADDWAYEHLGIFGWTTEFWDPVHAATGTHASTMIWFHGPSDDERLAVYRWIRDQHPDGYVAWGAFEHPQLGPIEIGGWDRLHTWVNPPPSHLASEVAPHADAIIHQARCSPRLTIAHHRVHALGDDLWRVEVGISNTGWLPTYVSSHAAKHKLVREITAEISAEEPASQPIEIVDGPARRRAGQLAGRLALRFRDGNDGTPDRTLIAWTVRAARGSRLRCEVRHDRAGSAQMTIVLT